MPFYDGFKLFLWHLLWGVHLLNAAATFVNFPPAGTIPEHEGFWKIITCAYTISAPMFWNHVMQANWSIDFFWILLFLLHGFPFSGSKDIGILIIVLWVPFHFVPNSENAHSFNILHLSFHYNLIFLHPQEMCCFCCSLPYFDNASLENVLINWYKLLTYRIFWPVFDNMGKMLHLPYFLLALEHSPFILHWMQYAHD